MLDMKRRAFISLLGSAAIMRLFSWPLAARAEAKPKMLRVGYVGVQSPVRQALDIISTP
jgi:hypothetical protein